MSQHRFGLLSYLNCLPATLGLEQGQIQAEGWEFSRGTPAQLNELMRSGGLDVSLVSAAEYLQNEDLYHLLEGVSLWCDGPVESVCLYSTHSREELRRSRGRIAVTPESATSVALTRILLPGVTTEAFQSLERARVGLQEGHFQAILLIGDKALDPPSWTQDLQVHDLGSWWKEETGHPMTFAVWVARAELDRARVEQAKSLLKSSLAWGTEHLEFLLKVGQERSGLSAGRLRDYLAKIQFRTTSRSRAGFLEFRSRLRAQRVLSPQRFFSRTLGLNQREKVSAL